MNAAGTAFVQSNPGLIAHLSHTYKQLERDEVESEMWLAAAAAGARKGYDNPDGISDRGMRKRRARTAAERAKIAAMRDTFGGGL